MRGLAAFLCVTALGLVATTLRSSESNRIHPVHAIHAENGLECTDCHANATSSVVGTDLLLPSKDVCADCHDVDDDEECGICHVDPGDPVGYAPRSARVQKFPHATHAELGCAECHGESMEVEPVMPSKASCRTCHPTATALVDCHLCHAASEPLVPQTHGALWNVTHGVDAGWEDQSCMVCHTQTDCQDCHAGDNVRPRSHRLNFAFEHAVVARANELVCQTCHSSPQFCSSCHAAEQVLPRDHSRADWVLTGGGGRHAEEGRFNLEACVACHDQGAQVPSCARCHGG